MSQTSRSSAGSRCLCAKGREDVCPLPIEYCFPRSVVRRSHGEKQERTVDEAPCATSWVALEGRLARPCMPRPVGGAPPARRYAAAREEAGHQTVGLRTHGASAAVECQYLSLLERGKRSATRSTVKLIADALQLSTPERASLLDSPPGRAAFPARAPEPATYLSPFVGSGRQLALLNGFLADPGTGPCRAAWRASRVSARHGCCWRQCSARSSE